ncbi:extracellular matrix protein 3-like [Amphiura filiformis]|uniref:extracellular matrix protein 3-like n=1 Tax=Amphiura filiformis TaxID=82378 RepID=UPI003B218D2E
MPLYDDTMTGKLLSLVEVHDELESLTTLDNLAESASYPFPVPEPPQTTENFDYNVNSVAGFYSFLPDDPDEKEIGSITVNNDFCPAPDEQFGFQFGDLSAGLCVGDSDEITYDTITFVIENDDVTYCWDDITLSVQENTGVVTAILTRIGYTGGTTRAFVRTDPGSATADVDYETIISGSSDGTIEFGPDVTEIPIMIGILEDLQCETLAAHDETFTLMIESPSEGKICTDSAGNVLDTVTITILHDDVIFAFQKEVYRVSETQREVEVVVELIDGPLDRDVIIDVISQPSNPTCANPAADCSADPGFDYFPADIDTKALSFPAGSTTASVTVTVQDDNILEEDQEEFQLVLVQNPLGLPACTLDNPNVVDVLIEDDDCCWSVEPPQLVVSEVSRNTNLITFKCERPEGSMVTPSFPVTATIEIGSIGIVGDPKASEGSDYTRTRTQVTINGGSTSTDISPFTIKDDILEESSEYFEVTLESADDGQLCGPLTTTVEIEDNDVTVHIASCNNTILESGRSLPVTLKRTGDLSTSDSILFITKSVSAQPDIIAGDGDYGGKNVLRTFTAMESTITEVIVINDDDLYEGDEEFIIQIERQNQETNVNIALDICRVTIIDDDYCTFELSIPESSKSVTEGNEVTITVSRSGYQQRPVSVYIEALSVEGEIPDAATSGQDYFALSKLLTFGEGETSQTVTLTVNDDDIPEVVEHLKVVLSNSDCRIGTDDAVIISIEDNDGTYKLVSPFY